MLNKRGRAAPMTKGVAKVPVVMQMEAVECGAAAIAMVLAYYGKWLPLERVRSDCGVSRDGTNAKNLLRAARGYGLEAKGYRYSAERVREKATFPCVLHWCEDHFVVLDGFKKGKARLNDPEQGVRDVPMDEFEKNYSGVCLLFEPGVDFVRSGKPRSVLAFAKKRLKGARAAFAFVMLTTAISSVMELIQPGFARVFVDRLLTGDSPGWLYPFLAALTAYSLVLLLLTIFNTVYLLRLQGKLAVSESANYIWHVLRLPMEFFSQRATGEIIMRQGYNEGIANSLIGQLAPLGIDFLMMIVYFAVMLRYSVPLTLIGLVSIAADLTTARVISKKRVNAARVQMRDSGNLANMTASGIELIESIKASGTETGFFEKWSGYLADMNAKQTRFVKTDVYLGAIPGVVSTLTSILVLLLGVSMVMRGEFTVGMILAFHGFMTSFQDPAQSLIEVGQSIEEMRTGMELVEDVMEYPIDAAFAPKECAEGEENEKLTGEIVMRDVTFGYARLGEPILEHFNLALKPGGSVALVGPSGCGKSTVAKLLTGLCSPWSGEILFDGRPIEQIDRDVFTCSVAMVDQDIILFEDTIANNIKLWDDTVENFEMVLAAKDAFLHDEILSRNKGYAYRIMDGGRDFSGGQRQRLEIARVLARDPSIVVLDEATSALDAKTEYDVMNAIRARGLTSVVIAHRLSTIRDCDEIIVLDAGRVVERGTHDALLTSGGLYAHLVCGE